ncbi:site-specific DNA-methyltransferase [Corynebacterium sp. zg-331]|uniref:site-specific DNA-methyltransferase n=1 Tax=unclassified Corynebacterium TaxID=2624378 RepID=UPI00128C03EF|nr:MULTISPECIES: site-specific DNA-methyltransferase [unclassified Corynebacterium]MBC3186438.1 site-specific DNA-methyltransferase [Corynebacterium sp. zg-331]MPV52924.1 site-specific DNA-methyltransferase [Corynebacterium sp. zg331]
MTKQRLQLTWYNKDKALIPTETGKYGYTWVDPSDPRYCETHTLIMDEYVRGVQSPKNDEFEYSERADVEPQDDNLLILGESGDVLEALTRVPELAKKYVGKIKLIYIDPPFNTAQTFANYEDNLEHSVWLTMMRDRLLHMKKLLSEDGSIWVHLDDVEVHRMRLLMDEVFGARNFVAEVVWQKADGPRNNAEGFSSDHDTILIYENSELFNVNRMARSASDNARFKNPDGDPDGPWWDGDPTARHAIGKRQHPSVYGIQHPITGKMIYPGKNANWYFAQETMLELMRSWGNYQLTPPDPLELEKRGIIEGAGVEIRTDVHCLTIPDWGEEAIAFARERLATFPLPRVLLRGKEGAEGGFGLKAYIPDRGVPPQTWWSNTEVGHNRGAKNEIKKLFPNDSPFSTPKPERLLERIIHIGSNPGDIVLDVFGGSGTTAAVAQKMGRHWVTCELVEDTFDRFTRPRLVKVVNDEDPGGITRTKGGRIAADGVELPDGVSPDDAAKFTSVLNKLIADDPELKKDPRVKALKSAAKTKRSKDVVNWRGGGGFQVAHLSPACFDYDPTLDRVMLTAAASGQTLIDSVAANLGFTLLHPDDDYVFDARRGNALLKVVEGVATPEIVEWLATQVWSGETIVLAATTVMDGVRHHLRKLVKGSRVIAIPDDIFRYSEGGDV